MEDLVALPIWCKDCPKKICQEVFGEPPEKLWEGFPHSSSEAIQNFVRTHEFCSLRIILSPLTDEVMAEIVELGCVL